VIYQIWGTISDSRGAISADQNILKLRTDSKNKNYICNFRTKLIDAHRLHSSSQKYKSRDIGLVM